MTQQKYLKANKSLGLGQINLEGDDIKCMLVNATNYTVNISADQFLSDIPLNARISISPSLTGRSVSDLGVFDANDTVFSSVSGDQADAFVIFIDTGVEGTSRLISYDDTSAQLPITPNGTDINVSFDSGANKIFKI